MSGVLFVGDAERELRGLESRSVDCVVTSPPYFRLRDYGIEGQIGRETAVDEYLERMLRVTRQIYRVLKPDGLFFLNIGDTYSGTKGRKVGDMPSGNLLFVPHRLVMAMQQEDWIIRQDIIWHKTNAMGGNIKDRCIPAHEYIFMCSKIYEHYFDHEAIQTDIVNGKDRSPRYWGGKNKHAKYGTRRHSGRLYVPPTKANARTVWPIGTSGFKGDHPAVFPPKLVERMVLAGCPPGGTVLDPFFGSGTVGLVCESLGRNWIGTELNPNYADSARARILEAHPSARIMEA